MPPRFWVFLLSLLLLAAPVGETQAEIVDAKEVASLCDDDVVTHVVVLAPTDVAGRAVLTSFDEVEPTAPVIAGVFRPPRRSFV